MVADSYIRSLNLKKIPIEACGKPLDTVGLAVWGVVTHDVFILAARGLLLRVIVNDLLGSNRMLLWHLSTSVVVDDVRSYLLISSKNYAREITPPMFGGYEAAGTVATPTKLLGVYYNLTPLTAYWLYLSKRLAQRPVELMPTTFAPPKLA